MERPYYPIIYIRGFAFTQGLIDETTADPYMGFNEGSTKYRQRHDGRLSQWFFESPVVRLMKDYGYRDVFDAGQFLPDEMKPDGRSIVIFRYYERSSEAFGTGERLPLVEYARDLHKLIETLQERCCKTAAEKKKFRVYLVAHSMGGLIARCFLQNPEVGTAATRRTVDKVFTYATPHRGIDLRVIGNVPGFATFSNATNFDRTFMKKYLALPKNSKEENVNNLNGKFDPRRFFCLVGTNPRDYAVGGGAVSKLVGPLSDGLVRMDNAAVWGKVKTGDKQVKLQAPRAYVHRSHSGEYGIVNSEEGYLNLTRFLFGDVRIDGILDVKEITLPPKLQKKKDQGKKIRAGYHIETAVGVRGSSRAFLHQRLYDHGSAVHRTYDELVERKAGDKRRKPHLFSQFLDSGRKADKRRKSLGFRIFISVRVPEYEVDNKYWFDDHYEGSAIFSDSIHVEATPPDAANPQWRLKYSFESEQSTAAVQELAPETIDGALAWKIPIRKDADPGIDASLILRASAWE